MLLASSLRGDAQRAAKLPYAADRAFAPVILTGRSPNVLLVTLEALQERRDLVAAARRSPGQAHLHLVRQRTSAHLAGELFANLAEVDLMHVP